MTSRQQKRFAKNKSMKPSIVTKPTNGASKARKEELSHILGYLKGILVVKQEKELMWQLIEKYSDEVMRAFTPRG